MSITNPNIIIKRNALSDLEAYADGSLTEYRSDKITTFKEYALSYMSNLKAIDCPNVVSLPTMRFAYQSLALEEVSLPSITTLSNVLQLQNFPTIKKAVFTSVVSVGTNVYLRSTSLEYADFSSLVDVPRPIYGFFQDCASLKTVLLDSAKTISQNTFQSCTSLTSISLPSATLLDFSSFYNCSSLNEIILSGTTMATLASISVFQSSGITTTTGFIRVPAALVNSYKSAANWSTFANRIFAIE